VGVTRTPQNQRDTHPACNGTANYDPRVAHALRSAGCNYQLTPSGDYVLSFELPRDRTHTVIINSRTAQVGIRELRCIYACGYASEDPLPGDVMTELLTRNADYHIGAWEIAGDEEMRLAILAACIAADSPAVELVCVALCLAQAADDLEESLTADDRF